MAIFTALAAIATIGGALSANKQQKKAEATARRDSKAQEDKAREAASLREVKQQDVRTKIGVSDEDAPGVPGSGKRGTATRSSGTGLGGVTTSASKIGGL